MPFKPSEQQPDFSRLNAYLVNSGIQTKNNALFQTIDLLIRNTGRARDLIIKDIDEINDSISSLLILIQRITKTPEHPYIDHDDYVEPIQIPGPPGLAGISGVAGASGVGGPGIDGIDGLDSYELGPPGISGNSVQIFEQSSEPTGAKPGDFWIEPL